jgi:hypothetical protein
VGMPQPWGFTLHFKNKLNFFCRLIDMCRVMPKDEGITKIKGSCEMVAERMTHVLLMPLSKGVTQHK